MTDTSSSCLVINNLQPPNHAFNNIHRRSSRRSRAEDHGDAKAASPAITSQGQQQQQQQQQDVDSRLGGGGAGEGGVGLGTSSFDGRVQPAASLDPAQLSATDAFGAAIVGGRASGAVLGAPKASKQVGALIDVLDRVALDDYVVSPAAAHPALVPLARASVDDLLRTHVARAELTGDERAFFVGDLSSVYSAVQQWRASPLGDRVELFYAVKCNPSPPVLHLLAQLGCSFDCASLAEIDAVLSLPPRTGSSAPPGADRIIFANPCKPASYVRAARDRGVGLMTFDNADELRKVARLYPDARLVLRILTDDSKSLCRLGLKFGSPLEACPGLLRLARDLGLNVVGVSFHVGSGSKDCDQFKDAIERARRAFDMAAAEGYHLDLLDVGGGFEAESFADASRVLRDALDLHFPRSSGVRIIAEPGRFLVSSAFTLATSIIARRRALEPNPPTVAGDEAAGADVMYYLNDGVYGSFNCIMFDHQIVHPYALTLGGGDLDAAIPRSRGPPTPPNVKLATDLSVSMGYTATERASVWGPTCDSIDCVRDLVDLPAGLDVGDWLAFGEMGAYTMCAASRFNGMPLSEVRWTVGDQAEGRQVLDVWEK